MRFALTLLTALVFLSPAAQAKPKEKPRAISDPKPRPTSTSKPRATPSPKPSPKPIGLWTEPARRLIGEPDAVTKRSIAELRRDKALPEKLKKALGTKDHFLALDVISTLKMRELVPTLLAFAERDRTGYSYHALNGLIERKDEERVTKLYVERLAKEKTSLASKMALLDTVGRFGTDVPTEVLNRLLVEDAAEVRSAALYYLRNGILLRRRQELYPFLKSAAKDPTFQIRLQTLYLVSEIPLEDRRARADLFNSLFESCAADTNALVKSLCTDIAAATWGKAK
jgi:hypothetical protein